MSENYSYPINSEWRTEELIAVMDMWTMVERAYEEKVMVEDILAAHKAFKSVVKSIGEERELGRSFEEATGYSLYRVMQAARKQEAGVFNRKDLKK